LKTLFAIGLGGFIGSVLRYLCSISFSKVLINDFPIGTLLVNIIGCFFIGLIINSSLIELSNFPIDEFMIIGLLGGFTTFSAFGIESYTMIKNGNPQIAILYIVLSIILSLIAIYISSKFNGNV